MNRRYWGKMKKLDVPYNIRQIDRTLGLIEELYDEKEIDFRNVNMEVKHSIQFLSQLDAWLFVKTEEIEKNKSTYLDNNEMSGERSETNG